MKHWQPIPEVIEAVTRQCRRLGAKRIIDIGGNATYRFPEAQQTVGWEGEIRLNLSHDPLPFGDQEIDFVFCRHTVEDMADPEHLLREIRRVARAGYLETPSPLAELCRGTDALGNHLGYSHHRWICYSRDGEFRLVAKYPVVERLPLPDPWGQLQDPLRWNSYHLWEGQLQYRILENERGFRLCDFDERGCQIGYLEVLWEAMRAETILLTEQSTAGIIR